MSVFKKIFVDAWSARMEYILSNTLLALLEYPDSTLLGVNRMLSDKHYRKKVIDNITDPAVKSFWVDEFLNYNERYMQEAGDAIKNKIGQFTANPLIRNIIGQPKSSFDIRKIMDERKILIMNLSKGLVGETNANLLGSMLTTRIYLAAMSRADLPVEQMGRMPNFYFYVDEFQSFANATFANILSEARKYKLNLTIAHQYIEQMEEDVRNAVFGNVGTVIAFRVGPFDAEVLETIFSPRFLATDIVNLGFAQIYLTLMIDGIGSAPFSAVTLPPLEPDTISHKNQVVAASREQFASARAAVEAAISAWHEEGRPVQEERKNDKKSRDQGRGGNDRPNHSAANGENRSRERREPVRTEERPPVAQNTLAVALTAPVPPVAAPVTQTTMPEPSPTHARVPQQAERGKEGSTQAERPRRDTSSRQERPAVRTHVQLGDLRSVLANISKVSASETSERPREKEKETSTVGAQKPGDLRSALAAALGSVEKKKPDILSNTQESPAAVHDRQKKQKQQYPSKAESPVHSNVYKEGESSSDHKLDPKKLERMMRVTTSDKPPIR